jgi:dihydroorotate dehydrogenase
LELRELKPRLVPALAQSALPLLTRLDPELAHGVGLKALRWAGPLWPKLRAPESLAVNCLGLNFAHCVGLAAGFDKNGDCLDGLGALGFSHVELGTVTPRPQPGNPKPRMFRFRDECALINRMGFNNKGVDHLVAQLSRSRYSGVRGVSIGKNFDTPLEDAQDDYLHCLRKVYALADYVAINVSSPNTARLRELQGREGLRRIVSPLLEERALLAQRTGKRVPLLVKIAPDLDDDALRALADDARALQIDGIIATNTSIDHGLLSAPPTSPIQGGLSGAPIHSRSRQVIAQLRAEFGPSFPIIGVGGIVSADNALSTLKAGANLLQIYTGFAYHGAALIEDIVSALAGRPRT